MGFHVSRSELRLVAGLLRPPSPGSKYGVQVTPALPQGELVQLSGHRPMFVRMVEGPVGALPAVLLHGWTWNADLNFAGVFAGLAEHHPVIAPDALGHGRTARATGAWRVEDATDAVIELLDELSIQRAILCGFSMGGVMAVDAAVRHPDRVAGIVVQSSAACYTTTRRDRMLWRLLALLWPLARRWKLRTLSARGFASSLHRSASLRQRWDWARFEMARMTMAEILTVADCVRTADARPSLATPPACPAEYSVLTGDRLCRPALQRELAGLIAAVETDVPGDHDLPLVDPEAYGALTVAAIRRVASRVDPIAKVS